MWFTKEEALLFRRRRRRRRQFRQFRKLFRILSDFLKMRNPTLRTVFLEQSFQPFQFLLLIIIIRFLDFSSFYGFVVRVSVFVAQFAFLSKHLRILFFRLFCFLTSVFFFYFVVDDEPHSLIKIVGQKNLKGTFFHFTQIPKKKKKNSLSLYQILNAKRERERLFERALIKG
jgi:hypothetical protein